MEKGLVAQEDWVETKRQSTLRCLDYARKLVTGSRPCAKPKGPNETTSMGDILGGLAVEAYAEVLEGWELVPNRFF